MSKHIALRRCVICRQSLPKSELSRYTLNVERSLQKDGKKAEQGRGYYVCLADTCRERFVKYRVKTK